MGATVVGTLVGGCEGAVVGPAVVGAFVATVGA